MFDGIYEFRNQSRDKLYVESMTGLGGCGYLIPYGVAGVFDRPKSYPAKAVIKWKVVGKGGWKTERLNLESLLKPQRKAMLVIQYTKDGQWQVFFEKYMRGEEEWVRLMEKEGPPPR
jgi:hypothetical protein